MDRVCPLLGLAVDRRAVIDGVDGAHRCHAESPPDPLDHRMQAQRCLTPAHERCERLLAYVARGGALPGTGPGGGMVTTRLVLAPEPAWRGMAGRARRARRGPVIAAAAATLAVGAGGIALGAAVLDGRLELGRAGGIASPSSTVQVGSSSARSSDPPGTPPATPSRSEEPTASPAVSASVAPPASATPSRPPTPLPATPLPATPVPEPSTYTVVQGDTLASIAQAFGTTVEALQALNGIDDPDEIIIGQVLTLP